MKTAFKTKLMAVMVVVAVAMMGAVAGSESIAAVRQVERITGMTQLSNGETQTDFGRYYEDWHKTIEEMVKDRKRRREIEEANRETVMSRNLKYTDQE